MDNYTDPYNPTFYAQEGLIILEEALGMAGRVYRGFDNERRSVNKGETIQIRKPGTFSTQPGGTGTPSDINSQYITISVDKWREVKFGLTDQELAYTGPDIINEHIAPAVYAIADYIEEQLTDEYKNVPWSHDMESTISAADIIDTRKVLRDNAGALVQRGDLLHFAIDSYLESKFLNLDIFHQAATTGEGVNRGAILNGSLGTRFGVEHFVQQTLADHTGGSVLTGTDQAGTCSATVAIRATSVAVTGLTGDKTLKAGDSFVIAGNSQRYSITADAAVTSEGTATLFFYPQAVQEYNENSVITFEDASESNFADRYHSNIMFHRNAFAIALAPLPEIGNEAGARMSTIVDPRTKLSMRARVAYDDTKAKVLVTLDVLFGVKTIEPNLAVIARRDYA